MCAGPWAKMATRLKYMQTIGWFRVFWDLWKTEIHQFVFFFFPFAQPREALISKTKETIKGLRGKIFRVKSGSYTGLLFQFTGMGTRFRRKAEPTEWFLVSYRG